jgi:hypothetical protein
MIFKQEIEGGSGDILFAAFFGDDVEILRAYSGFRSDDPKFAKDTSGSLAHEGGDSSETTSAVAPQPPVLDKSDDSCRFHSVSSLPRQVWKSAPMPTSA